MVEYRLWEVRKIGNIGGPDGFYVIGEGVFEVVRKGATENVMARMESLSFFGEMSLVSGAPRVATVRCVEAGRLKRFPLKDFNGLLERDNLQAYKVIRNMAHILAERFDKLGKRFVAEILDAAAGH